MNEENEKYQKVAQDFLAKSPLMPVLRKYGEVMVAGSYKSGLMMYGDIDIYVTREVPYTKKEILDIFGDLYNSTDFRSYFIHGDWNDTRKGNEFPNGHYIGAKFDMEKERWEIDIWFVSKEELSKRQNDFFDVSKMEITDAQRTAILEIKKYKKEHKIQIPSQQIYEAVINKNIRTLQDFLREVGT